MYATPYASLLPLSSLPSNWLAANIIPAYKKGNKSTPANYQPISLTAICSKVMEHIIFHSIMNHLNTHKIINPNQCGFRPGFSCSTQLMFLVDDILKAMDSHSPVDLVATAWLFYSIQSLCSWKIANFGIQSNIHKWITTWLTSRTQSSGWGLHLAHTIKFCLVSLKGLYSDLWYSCYK